MHRINTIAVFLSVLLLAGCDMSVPSRVNTQQIQVREAVKTATLDAARIDAARVDAVAHDYARNGRGGLSLTISYLAGDPALRAAADRQGRLYGDAFARRGVTGVNVSTVEVADRIYAGKAVASYTALTAQPPPGCGRIPGYQGAGVVKDMEEYDVGCETASVFSKMVADPSDLMGKGGMQDDDSRRQGAAVENYKAGKPNPKLQGLNASSVGANSSGGGQ